MPVVVETQAARLYSPHDHVVACKCLPGGAGGGHWEPPELLGCVKRSGLRWVPPVVLYMFSSRSNLRSILRAIAANCSSGSSANLRARRALVPHFFHIPSNAPVPCLLLRPEAGHENMDATARPYSMHSAEVISVLKSVE